MILIRSRKQSNHNPRGNPWDLRKDGISKSRYGFGLAFWKTRKSKFVNNAKFLNYKLHKG